MEESLDAYVEELGFGKQWVDLHAVDSDGDGEEEELESDRFALPGDEDFCDDHAWKHVGANEGDKDEAPPSNFSGGDKGNRVVDTKTDIEREKLDIDEE